jgi:ABC-type bacteriocin/lantibiotic exporter with double-glycine peptidase domain
MDCGPSCPRMIARFYGKSYSLQSLRSKSFITNTGVTMLGISDAAESIGFRTRGYRLTWEQLHDKVPLPCIVHWSQRHFVVVYNIKKSVEHGAQSKEQRAESGGQRAESWERGAGSRERRAESTDFASRFRRTKAVAFFDHYNPDCSG